ncbi:1-acyl-sn-glycerol-3-phosphate acyltransferase [Yimella sp. cx-573]|nr:1-acyl-sn-glycerol-3-phosphate acyltransferase [Yimella sp. cx-573]
MAEVEFDRGWSDRGRRIGNRLVKTGYRAKALHPERVPVTGPVIIVSNHTGFLDGPVVFCLAPRTVHFLVKKSYFKSVWGKVLTGVGQIPIEQRTGDREALAAAKSLLAQGYAVGMFPEGTRGSGTVETAHQGAAWLALQTGAQIIPTATLGTRGTGSGRESWPKPGARLRVVFGEAFALPDYTGVPGRQKLALATEEIRERLARQVSAAVVETGLVLPSDAPPPPSN